jgi:hypothetical protein
MRERIARIDQAWREPETHHAFMVRTAADNLNRALAAAHRDGQLLDLRVDYADDGALAVQVMRPL